MQQAKSGLGSPTLPVKENSSSPVQQDGSAEQSPTSPSHSGSPLSSSMMPSQLVEESILQVQLVQQVKQPTSPLTPRDKKPTVSSSSHIVDKRSTVSPHQHTELGKKQVAFSVTLANMDNKFTTSPVLPSQLGKQVTPLTPTKEVKQSTAQSGKPASAHVTSPKPKVESATSACTPKASAYLDKQPVTKQASPSRIVKPETGLPKSSPVVISTKKADGAFASPVKQVNTNEIVASSTIPAKPGPILLQPASTVSSSAPEAAAGGVRTNTKGVSSATQPTTSKGKATGNMEPKKEGDNRIQTRVMKREKMAEGDVIKSDNFTWKIIKLIGSGGFGDVYKVVKADNEDKKEYALKTETCEGDKRVLRLKIEVCIMKLCCNVERPDRKKHFVEMIDRGKNDKFKFLVMTLVGQSLEDIRRNILRRNYSKPTAMQIAYQTLQSIYDLHELGYLHRDLKPQNFAIGLEPQRHIIYMLDFGIARKFTVGLTKELKAPRLRVKFIGTIRFASRACHNGIEQGRKDDLESWLYLAFDVLDNINGLPWKRLDRREFTTVLY
ncbi:hypothetical protein DICVIV_05724 [Dictyocaulus viviparus]|uniref:Protein kinase domain-containing protein n=1 Tax=Dictyocaulus viviparus TaxID=29172 RepID=A0A0D8XUF2_DICVI|nr:hypothetical protein DICVIV_05724 [Dictyocaulus viviparus]